MLSRGLDRFSAYIAPGMVGNGWFEIDFAGNVAAVVLETEELPGRYVRVAKD